MKNDAEKEVFEHIELFGKPALFTNDRIDRDTVPDGLFCYDLRGSDSDPGRPICVELHVGVNHAGTVLTAQEIDLSKNGYKPLRGGLNFLGETLTVRQFCEMHPKEERQNGVLKRLAESRRKAEKNQTSGKKPGRNDPSI